MPSHDEDPHSQTTAHFGYQKVSLEQKAVKVKDVFNSVANKYDLMNDLMSGGMHRFWKWFASHLFTLNRGDWALDIAAGSGDLSQFMANQVGKQGKVIVTDINFSMLTQGRNKLLNKGLYETIEYVQVNAEKLSFKDNLFQTITIGFGLRNVTTPLLALKEMYRVIQPGGCLVILEFSHPTSDWLKTLYDFYSFNFLPHLGQWIVGDSQSYQYLAESIRMHPPQQALIELMEVAQFEDCRYFNLLGGIVAVHQGYKY